MSQFDIVNAKKALAARLRIWGVPDVAARASGFIDDMVAQGWIMSDRRAARPVAPKLQETCKVPGHEGYRRDNCAGCVADRLAGEPTSTAPSRPGDHSSGVEACRASLRGA